MKIGIMQPYFFSYIGYWQLINAVDLYVFFDDVNYINRGWINRNRIMINNNPVYINLPILSASQNKKINELMIDDDSRIRGKLLRSIELAYKKAPYFNEIFPLIKTIIESKEKRVSDYLANSIVTIAHYLDMKTKFIFSSEIKKNENLKGQNKILEICKLLGADEYYNAIGGKELYNKDVFKNNNIRLCFLMTNNIEYKQFGNAFVPNLSIIDVLMFNSKEEVKRMLNEYKLL